MLHEQTYRQLAEMKMWGLAAGFQEYLDGEHDGDQLSFADRFGLMVDGVVWKGDVMMLPIYEEQLKRKPKTPVRIDARTSMIVDEAVKRWGGTSITQAIGHSKVKRGMDLDLAEEAKRAGYDDVDRYVQENPELAETFQGEFSLHLFPEFRLKKF